MTRFDLLPAIDLREGRVVRLRQGDFAAETSYSDDPVAVAVAFVDGGAKWLHVVDLDAARLGGSAHNDVIRRIVAAVGARASVEVAGGLRSAKAVAAMLDLGAARVIVGTAALADPAFAGALVASHGMERIAVALDVRDGLAVGHGWVQDAAGFPVRDAIGRLGAAGVRWFEVTAIDRDGMMGGADVDQLATLIAAAPDAWIVASGGIGSRADLRAVRDIGCAGAIVGRALYEGALTLRGALEGLAGLEAAPDRHSRHSDTAGPR